MGVQIPYPIPDPETGVWNPFALKQNLVFLASRIDSITAQNTAVVLRRDVGNPLLDIVSSNTETSVFTTPLTIAGGLFGTDRRLRISLLSDHLNNTGLARNLTYRQKYGGSTLAQRVMDVDASATRYEGESPSAELMALGSTSVQRARRISSGLASGSSTVSDTVTAGAVDSTIAQTYDFTLQWAIADASLSFRVYSVTVEML